MDRDEYETTMRERAFALILAAIIRAQLEPDVDLAFRVASMVVNAADDPADLDDPFA